MSINDSRAPIIKPNLPFPHDPMISQPMVSPRTAYQGNGRWWSRLRYWLGGL